MQGCFNVQEETCSRLPIPVLQMPNLLTSIPETSPDVDCAAALDLTDQDPAINHLMAGWITHVVRRLMAGDCPYMAVYMDLESGRVNPQYIDVELVHTIMRPEDGPTTSNWLLRTGTLAPSYAFPHYETVNDEEDDDDDSLGY